MKKGKSRHKRKKIMLLWIAIAVIGMAAITVAVCVAGMFKKEDVWKTPEELLVEYMNHIPVQEYEQMYAMLHIEASGNVSQEDFIKRNSAIYEGIEIQNMEVEIIAYDEEQLTVTYQTSFDTVAGEISFENEAFFLEGEDGYKLVWDDSLIFPNLASTDKVRVSTTQANRGEILDRNGRVLAGKGTASSVGIVPGKLENREEAIAKIAELLETTPEVIEKKLSAQWVKDDSFVPIKTIPRVEEIELMKVEPDEEVLKEKERHESLLAIPGVMISDVEVREYPLGEAAAHLVGYVQSVTAEDLEEYAGESRVIAEQSFDVDLNDWGKVRFVSYLPTYDTIWEDVSFVLAKDNQIVYYFPACFENNSTENDSIGIFDSVEAVGFQDIDGDNAKDVIVIINYVTGAGPQGMLPRKSVRIFKACDNGFVILGDMMSEIRENMDESELSVPIICEYIESN